MQEEKRRKKDHFRWPCFQSYDKQGGGGIEKQNKEKNKKEKEDDSCDFVIFLVYLYTVTMQQADSSTLRT